MATQNSYGMGKVFSPKQKHQDWGYSSTGEHLPSVHEALDLIPNTGEKTKTNKM